MSELSKFLKRVVTATNAKSKNVSLTIIEAQALSAELSGHLEKENSLLETVNTLQGRIIELQNQESKGSVSSELEGDVNMDGGGFK